MRKKVLSLFLAMSMVLSMVSVGAFAAEETPATTAAPAAAEESAAQLGDVGGHWAESAIDRWSGYGVVKGDQYGNFNPNAGMTRAASAQTFSNLMKLDGKGKADLSAYVDVDQNAWYAPALAAAVEAGIIKGTNYPGTPATASPNLDMSREQFFVMFARSMGIPEEPVADVTLADSDQVSSWARGSVNALMDRGYVKGAMDAAGHITVSPAGIIDRASVAALLDQTISTYAAQDNQTVKASPEGVTLVVADNVTVTGEAQDVTLAGGNATLDGVSAESVNVTTDSPVSLTGKSEVAHLNVSAEGADVSVGVNSSVTLAKVDAPAEIKANGAIAAVEVGPEAAGSAVSGKGSVESVYAETLDVEVTTPNTEVLAMESEENAQGGVDSTTKTFTNDKNGKAGDVTTTERHTTSDLDAEGNGTATYETVETVTGTDGKVKSTTETTGEVVTNDNVFQETSVAVTTDAKGNKTTTDTSSVVTTKADGSVVTETTEKVTDPKGKTTTTETTTANQNPDGSTTVASVEKITDPNGKTTTVEKTTTEETKADGSTVTTEELKVTDPNGKVTQGTKTTTETADGKETSTTSGSYTSAESKAEAATGEGGSGSDSSSSGGGGGGGGTPAAPTYSVKIEGPSTVGASSTNAYTAKLYLGSDAVASGKQPSSYTWEVTAADGVTMSNGTLTTSGAKAGTVTITAKADANETNDTPAATGSITVTIETTNHAPTVTKSGDDLKISVNKGATDPVIADVSGFFADVDGDTLTYTVIAGGTYVKMDTTDTTKVVFETSGSNTAGAYSFTVRATDTAGLYADATFTLTVKDTTATATIALKNGNDNITVSGSDATYTASVDAAVTAVTLVVTPDGKNATITYALGDTAQDSSTFTLATGSNALKATVKAEDGTTTKTYTVTVTKAAAQSTAIVVSTDGTNTGEFTAAAEGAANAGTAKFTTTSADAAKYASDKGLKVYTAASGGSASTDVTAAIADGVLTLTFATGKAPAANMSYYVSVTREGETESERTKVDVTLATAEGALDALVFANDTYTMTATDDKVAKFTLKDALDTTGITFKFDTDTAETTTEISSNAAITAVALDDSDTTSKTLKVTFKENVAADATYYLTMTKDGKTESARTAINVKKYVAPPTVAATDKTISANKGAAVSDTVVLTLTYNTDGTFITNPQTSGFEVTGLPEGLSYTGAAIGTSTKTVNLTISGTTTAGAKDYPVTIKVKANQVKDYTGTDDITATGTVKVTVKNDPHTIAMASASTQAEIKTAENNDGDALTDFKAGFGTAVTLTVAPTTDAATLYDISAITLNDGDVEIASSTTNAETGVWTVKFTMPGENVEVTATMTAKTPAGTMADKAIAGERNTALADSQTVVVTLTAGKFASTPGVGLFSFTPALPEGVKISTVAVDNTDGSKATLTISGTPTAAVAKRAIGALTIDKAAFEGGETLAANVTIPSNDKTTIEVTANYSVKGVVKLDSGEIAKNLTVKLQKLGDSQEYADVSGATAQIASNSSTGSYEIVKVAAGEGYRVVVDAASGYKAYEGKSFNVTTADVTQNIELVGIYDLTKDTVTNGTIGDLLVGVGTSNASSASKGDKVTFTVTANEGYKVKTVSYNDGEDHTLTESDNKYTFTMPAHAVTVKATFELDPTPVKMVVTVYNPAEGSDSVETALHKKSTDLTPITITPKVTRTEAGKYTVTFEGTGTVPYVTGFTGFSSKAEEQSGYYLSLLFDVSDAPDSRYDASKGGVDITTGVGANHRPLSGFFDENGNKKGIQVIRINGKTDKYALTFDWGVDTLENAVYTFDFSGLTLGTVPTSSPVTGN